MFGIFLKALLKQNFDGFDSTYEEHLLIFQI